MQAANSTRVAVVGATGNLGSSIVAALQNDPQVDSIVAISRREPTGFGDKVHWRKGDILKDDLPHLFRDVDCVIHLAWTFHPTHDPVATWRTNVLGSLRVFDAVAAANVPALLYASSVAAYSPGPERAIDESWPTHGWPGAAYPREKAYLERCLDVFAEEHPDIRVVRMRTAFCFKAQSASEQRRIFIGPLLPNSLVRPELLPAIPSFPGLQLQALHSDDVAEAYRLAVHSDARGAFNVAAEPVIDAAVLSELFGARTVPVPSWPIRGLLAALWQMRLVPASPDLFDTFLHLPIMDTTRVRTELGWSPRYTATETLEEFLRALRQGTGGETPPLRPSSSTGRLSEVLTAGTRV